MECKKWLNLNMFHVESRDGSAGTLLVALPAARTRGMGLLCSRVLSSPCEYRRVHIMVVTTSMIVTTSSDHLFISKINGRRNLGWKM